MNGRHVPVRTWRIWGLVNEARIITKSSSILMNIVKQLTVLVGLFTLAANTGPFAAPQTQSSNSELPEIKLVVTEGYGTDVPSAAQNAAKNALTQVVGSFIDANKLLEKQVEIREGVRTQVQNIKTDIKEYSQGSIKSFEIINVGQQDGLTVVTAKAEILVEELNEYIKGIVGGEQEIAGTGLFAQASTKSKQNEDKVGILLDNVIVPLYTGEVIEFEISKPKGYEPNENYAQMPEIKELASKFGAENTFVFDVVAKINESYLTNAIKNLKGISRLNDKIRTNIYFLDPYPAQSKDGMSQMINVLKDEDFLVILHDGQSMDLVNAWEKSERAPWHLNLSTFPSTVYVVEDTKSRLKKSGDIGASFFEWPGVQEKKLIVEFTDGSGNVLQEATVNTKPLTAIAIESDYTRYIGLTTPWQLFGGNLEKNVSGQRWAGMAILKQRSFKLVVAINQAVLAKIQKISLTLQ